MKTYIRKLSMPANQSFISSFLATSNEGTFLLLALWLAAFSVTQAQAESPASSSSANQVGVGTTTFYVSTSGDDAGAGTQADPWETLAGARDNVQPMLDGTGHITVLLRGGTYTVTNTVVFGPLDSGTENQIVTYRAFPAPIFPCACR
jgi:hypothetical protein